MDSNAPADELEQLRQRLAEMETLLKSQQQLEQMLGKREELYRTVLESLTEGILITNHESKIIYANSRLEEITGYPKDEILGLVSYKLLLEPKEWPSMERRLKERLGGKEEAYEHEIRRKDGTMHWIRVRATPYRNAHGEIIGTVGALSCIQTQKELELENEYLLDEIKSHQNTCNIVGTSPALIKVLQQIAVVAPTEATVLILGESGTGKELVARDIHEHSVRKERPLVKVNCASVPKELFESEFFGHVRGAYTGAVKDRVGRFELADGGTLFLDEIGEIPLDLQAKLLRVLQEGTFERVGEERTRKVDIRLVAATNRDLLSEAKAGRFRLDLYYRLSVFPIELPSLRERREDIPALTEHFLKQSAKRMLVPVPKLTRAHARELMAYDWPGNVRELQNVVERAVILARNGPVRFDLGSTLSRPLPVMASNAPVAPAAEIPGGLTLADLKARERELILSTLQRTNGKIYGAEGAAALLGLKPTTLASKIKKLGLKKLVTVTG
jgi:PAS domain S-box-containing protein